MRILDVAQGTAEWRMARAGSLGASSVHEAVARTKTGWSASRANLMARLVVERLTGEPQDSYQSAAMVHGIETEPEARLAYEFWRNEEVRQVGLILHPTIAHTHASPDGLVGDEGLVEIKCPQPAQHLATLLGEAIQEKYIIQMQWQMRCCDRSWCDFVSYNPSFPESMQLFVRRVHRDDKRIAELEEQVAPFLLDVHKTVERLRGEYEPSEERPINILAAG